MQRGAEGDDAMQKEPWADLLAWVLPRLSAGTFQITSQTMMDDESIRNRPLSTPIPIMEGEIMLSAPRKRLLDQAVSAALSWPLEIPGRAGLPWRFVSFLGAPEIREHSITVGRPETERFTIFLRLRDMTDRIDQLRHPS